MATRSDRSCDVRRSESTSCSPDRHNKSDACPEQSWQQLHCTARSLELARQRGWYASEQKLLPRVSRCLFETIDELSRLRVIVDAHVQHRERPTLGNIWRDIAALPDEFDDVRYDAAQQALSAVTPPITLEGVELGAFEIRLELSKLGGAHSYRVVALEPSPSATNSSVTHPHVQDVTL
jgi:hypothetical protein